MQFDLRKGTSGESPHLCGCGSGRAARRLRCPRELGRDRSGLLPYSLATPRTQSICRLAKSAGRTRSRFSRNRQARSGAFAPSLALPHQSTQPSTPSKSESAGSIWRNNTNQQVWLRDFQGNPFSARFASLLGQDQVCDSFTSSANHAAHKRPLFARSFLTDVITVRDAALRFGKFGVAIVMNCGQRFSFFHAIADALVEFEADAVVDLVFLLFTAFAEPGEH